MRLVVQIVRPLNTSKIKCVRATCGEELLRMSIDVSAIMYYNMKNKKLVNN